MAIITFMSDLGRSDHYVAVVKAKILNSVPSVNIIDISHEVKRFDIMTAAYLLKSSFRNFPPGTIHLVSVDAPQAGVEEKCIAVRMEDHFFVGMDNGVFSLISQSESQYLVHLPSPNRIFPAFDTLASAAALLASGKSLNDIGEPLDHMEIRLNRLPRLTRSQLIGQVMHIDHYGNLVTNIHRKEFETAVKGRSFQVSFAGETFSAIAETYAVDPGDCVIVFNSNDYLEIAINQGNASELLGMEVESPVLVSFQGE